jgi:hypothetical protein
VSTPGGAPDSFATALERAQLPTMPATAADPGLRVARPDLARGLVSGAAGGSASGSAVVAAGSRYLGVPYRWGGTDPTTGLDCSGFVQRTYRDLGIELPRTSREQATMGQPVAGLADAAVGDILAFGSPTVNHVGIYAGNGMMIASPYTGAVVRFEKVVDTPTAIRRIIGTPAAATTSTATSTAVAGRAIPPADYRELLANTETSYGLPAGLLTAVAQTESGFDPTAVSRAGAQGLMQFMPATAQALGVDPFDPAQAIDGAGRLLAGHMESFGSLELALAAYNAGGGAVRRYGGVPPYAETQNYVQKIMTMVQGAGA